MSAHNRHLRGDTNDVLVDVHGNVEVEAGDFMFRDGTGGGRGLGISADNYAYPFSSVGNTASDETEILNVLYANFLGVAMESSPSGTTEKITIAEDGVFRYPLYRISAVTIGALVTSVSTATSTSDTSAQAVCIIGETLATTAYLGYVVKTESGASFVDFRVRTAFGSGGSAT